MINKLNIEELWAAAQTSLQLLILDLGQYSPADVQRKVVGKLVSYCRGTH